MDIFASFATDETKEEGGVVVFLTSDKSTETGPWIRVARMGNMAYAKAVTAAYESLQTAKKVERLTEDQMEIRARNVMIEALAGTVLKDFGNLEFQGAKMPPGRESHLQFLRVKDFREMVVTKANDVELYRVEYQAAAAKN